MRVAITMNVQEQGEGCYHLLGNDNVRSLCGAVNDDKYVGPDIQEAISRQEAEEKGLHPCEQCLSTINNKTDK